jgi:D-amino-acid dehydrogenase
MSTPLPPPAPPVRRDPDVIVIGGGIAGLFCAYHLRCRGASVAVVERGQVGGPASCSSGNTGFVGTQGAAPLAEPGVPAQGLRWLLNPESPFYIKPRWDPGLARWLWHFRRACNEQDAQSGFRVLLEMKKRSLAMLSGLCASSSLTASFSAPGLVVAFKTPRGFDQACQSVPQAVAAGVPLRVLSPEDLRALEPGVEFDISGALYNAEGACLRVPGFVTGFAETLARMGVAIHEDAEVTGFEVAGRTVTQVRTVRGDFRPGEVVIAAGAWSSECARRLGIGLMLQPAKGYSITISTPRNAPRLPVLLSEGKVALMPIGDRLRIGGTLELSGLDSTVSRRRVDGILRTVRAHFPGLETTRATGIWSGLRPCTPDSLPFIGRAGPRGNVLIASGYGHIGMGLAPAAGELIAQIAAGEQPSMDLAPFRTSRFARWAPRWPRTGK